MKNYKPINCSTSISSQTWSNWLTVLVKSYLPSMYPNQPFTKISYQSWSSTMIRPVVNLVQHIRHLFRWCIHKTISFTQTTRQFWQVPEERINPSFTSAFGQQHRLVDGQKENQNKFKQIRCHFIWFSPPSTKININDVPLEWNKKSLVPRCHTPRTLFYKFHKIEPKSFYTKQS